MQETMEKNGFTDEREARALLLLDEARRLFVELINEQDSGATLTRIVWRDTHVFEHFRALYRQLGNFVLRRDYPEGWGYRPPSDDEEDDKG